MTKKRMKIGSRMYERVLLLVGNEKGKKDALKEAKAWRDKGYWATIRKSKAVSVYQDYPATYVGPVWEVYKSIQAKEG